MVMKAGREEEYERRHNPIWKEHEIMLKQHGLHNYSIFLLPGTRQLFGYVECESEEQWAAIASTDVCKRWWKDMSELVDFHGDGTPNATNLVEVFHLE